MMPITEAENNLMKQALKKFLTAQVLIEEEDHNTFLPQISARRQLSMLGFSLDFVSETKRIVYSHHNNDGFDIGVSIEEFRDDRLFGTMFLGITGKILRGFFKYSNESISKIQILAHVASVNVQDFLDHLLFLYSKKN